MSKQGSENRRKVFLAIQGAERAASAAEIAEDVGVSPETVRNHLRKLRHHPEIRTREIGQIPIYWHSRLPATSEVKSALQDSTRPLTVGEIADKLHCSEKLLRMERGEWVGDPTICVETHGDESRYRYDPEPIRHLAGGDVDE